MILPIVFALVIASIMAGIFCSRIGYYVPLMIASSVITPIGAGLLTTFTTTTNHPKWIGYQVIYGFGLGLGMQQPSVAAQTVLTRKDVPTGIALVMFGQQLGGAIFVSVGQNVLSNRLIEGIKGVPGLDPHTITDAGATAIRGLVRPQFLGIVLNAYNRALTNVFDIVVAVSCLTIVGALAMEWKSVKKEKMGARAPDQSKIAGEK